MCIRDRLPVHATIFLLGWPGTRPRWRGALAALACFTLPYLPLVWWQWRLFTSPTFNPGFDFVPLPRVFAILLAAFGRGMRAVPTIGPVSYTHLRAHETVLDLVCRLLLEKKNQLL